MATGNRGENDWGKEDEDAIHGGTSELVAVAAWVGISIEAIVYGRVVILAEAFIDFVSDDFPPHVAGEASSSTNRTAPLPWGFGFCAEATLRPA